MVQFLKSFPGRLLHLSKVDQYSVILQSRSTQYYFNFPVMSVKIFTLATEIVQIMCCSKAADYFYFKNPLTQNKNLRLFKA